MTGLSWLTQPTAQPNVPPARGRLVHSTRFWVVLAPTALVAGAAATGLKLLLRVVEHAAFSYHGGELIRAAASTSAVHRVVTLAVAGALAAGLWWGLRRATGTIGGQMTGTIWSGEGRMATAPTLFSAGLTMTVIAMGASMGRESPPKEAAAALAERLARWGRLSDEERVLLMACAAGGAWAAVYNIPFAGAAFVAEVLMGSLALPVVLPAVITAVLATGLSWIVLPVHPYYLHVPAYTAGLPLLVWSVLVGPLLGIAAMAFVWLLGILHRHRVSGNWVLVGPLVAFSALGALSIAYPQLLGNGRDLAQNLFRGELPLATVAVLFALKPLVTLMCWGSGAPGGMYTPVTAYGALLGALLGRLWSMAWPGTPAGAYALVGATALVTAAMSAPVTGVLLMIELTHQLTPLLVPVILAAGGALLVAWALGGGSIYSARAPLPGPDGPSPTRGDPSASAPPPDGPSPAAQPG